MNVAFFHDHIVTKHENKLYSTGGINEKVISRYQEVFNEFTLVTRENSKRSIKGLTYIGSLNDISFVSTPNLASLNLLNHYKAYKLLIKAVEENDFIIVRLPSLIGYLALHIAKKRNKSYAVEMVGCPWDVFRYYGSLKGLIFAGPLYLISRHFLKNSQNTLYVTSKFLQRRYPSNGSNQINCSNVEIKIEDGVLDKRLSHIENNSNEITKIGLIGALDSKYKGFDTAIMAIKEISNQDNNQIVLEIVGGGNKNKIIELAKKIGVEKNVKIIGVLPHPDGIFNWLDKLNIFIHPSRVEGLPRVVIEAMSRACPCIGSDAGGIPELLDPKFIHKKNDHKTLADLIHIMLDKQLQKEQAIRNFNEAKNYDKDLLDEKRLVFYRKSISKIN